MDCKGKFEIFGAAADDSTWFMTRTQASTVLPVISQTTIKSCQIRHHGGTTPAAEMSDLNLKTKVRTRRILQWLLEDSLHKLAIMQDKSLERAAHGQTGDVHAVSKSRVSWFWNSLFLASCMRMAMKNQAPVRGSAQILRHVVSAPCISVFHTCGHTGFTAPSPLVF